MPHNLPSQRTPFVGRTAELAAITRLLVAEEDCRLLTVVGPGGMGKTRLALKVAEEIVAASSQRFADGVFFVPLENVGDADGLVSALISAIAAESGFPLHVDAPLLEQLGHFLNSKAMLLVLDNFEHLVSQATLLSELLGAAPGVKLLVTSRETLGLQEAWFYPLLGLTLPGREPGEIVEKVHALAAAADTLNPAALAVAAGTIAVIAGLKRFRPSWPGLLIAVVAASVAAALMGLPVETVGTRFGGIPRSLPLPDLPPMSWDKVQAVLPDAIAFALLGAIESLLSAVVADGMTGRRHRSNCELVAQGAANIGSALFGGICATGTIARTATNVRAGARGPVAGMLHSAFLLLFMLIAAPLAGYIPLAALAAVLAIVAWNMAEKHEFAVLLRASRGDAVVLLATFLLTVFRDLTEGIIVGFALGAVLFIHRMAEATGIEAEAPLVAEDQADGATRDRIRYDPDLATNPDVVVYRITGALFFGAASTVGSVLDRIADQRRAFVVDLSAVPFLDSTAANTLAGAARKAARRDVRFFVTGASAGVRRTLLAHGLTAPAVQYRSHVADAVAEATAS